MIVRTYKRRRGGSESQDPSSQESYGGSQELDEPADQLPEANDHLEALWRDHDSQNELINSEPLNEDEFASLLPSSSRPALNEKTGPQEAGLDPRLSQTVTRTEDAATGSTFNDKGSTKRGASAELEVGREALYSSWLRSISSFTQQPGPSKEKVVEPGRRRALERTGSKMATLIEAQESGEILEHVDEATFALGGLRLGQPVRVVRASLTTLVQICASRKRREMLQKHNLGRPLLKAVLQVPADDPGVSMAAAAILLLLASDGHNADILSSEACLTYLLRLLRPPALSHSLFQEGFAEDVASKQFIATLKTYLCAPEDSSKGEGVVKDGTKVDTRITATEIVDVRWLALRTLERTCTAAVLFEDDLPGSYKTSRQIKEHLRNMGGLSKICDLAWGVLMKLQQWMESHMDSASLSGEENIQCVSLSTDVKTLLSCMRILENVSFFSQANQLHLLELKVGASKADGINQPELFISFLLSVIDFLRRAKHVLQDSPELSFHKAASQGGAKRRGRANIFPPVDGNHASLATYCQAASFLQGGAMDINVKSPPVCLGQDPPLRESEKKSANNVKCEGTRIRTDESEAKGHGRSALAKIKGNLEPKRALLHEDDAPDDPFAFEEEFNAEIEQRRFSSGLADFSGRVVSAQSTPLSRESEQDMHKQRDKQEDKVLSSSILLESGEHRVFVKQAAPAGLSRGSSRQTFLEHDAGNVSKTVFECKDERSKEVTLVGECLVAAIKVLMNLTNETSLGTGQVAACGGLVVLSSLILSCYCSCFCNQGRRLAEIERRGANSKASVSTCHACNKFEEVDLLVVCLGALVNLVEKDEVNRESLASMEVPAPDNGKWHDHGERSSVELLSFLCDLFLSKQRARDAAQAVDESELQLGAEEQYQEGKREAEDMIVESYTALLLALLSKASRVARTKMSSLLPGGNLSSLAPVVERFMCFHVELRTVTGNSKDLLQELVAACRGSASQS
eukprot:SM000160S02555  [mRNA]  locus=s160:195946:200982:+ [translate_table: standard]